jgi:hypothetical protein
VKWISPSPPQVLLIQRNGDWKKLHEIKVFSLIWLKKTHLTLYVFLLWVIRKTLLRYVGFESSQAVAMKDAVMCDISSCSTFNINQRFAGTLPLNFKLLSCTAYTSTLNIETLGSFETSVDFQQIIRLYIQEVDTVHNHHSLHFVCYEITLWWKIINRMQVK